MSTLNYVLLYVAAFYNKDDTAQLFISGGTLELFRGFQWVQWAYESVSGFCPNCLLKHATFSAKAIPMYLKSVLLLN